MNNDIFASHGFKTTQFLHRLHSQYCWRIVFVVKVQESYNCPYVSHNEAFVSLLLGGSEWSESRPNRFNPEEIGSNTRWTGVWLCFREKLDNSAKRKYVAPDGNRNTGTRLVDRLVPRLGSNWWLWLLHHFCVTSVAAVQDYLGNIITYIFRNITCVIYKIMVMHKMYIYWNVHSIRLFVKTA